MEEKNKLNNLEQSGSCCGLHHKSPIKVGVMLVGLLIIIGGSFMLGRMTSHREVSRIGFMSGTTLGHPQEFSNNGLMMGGGRGETGYGRGGENSEGRMTGEVTAINDTTITIKSANADYTVLVSDTTSYRKSGSIAKKTDLKIGDNISIVGQSDSQGQINARIITIK